MTFTGVAFWYPPVQGTSAINFVYALLIISLHWGFFTVCFVPINALGPEIARSKKARTQLGAWVGIGMILGLTVAQVLPGIMIKTFVGESEEFSPIGYQKTAIIFAIISLICFQFPVWLIKERYTSNPEQIERLQPVKQVMDATRNRAFAAYFAGYFCLYIGFLAIQRMLPYWVELGMGGHEGYITFMMLPFILTAILSLPFILWIGKHVPIKYQLMLSFCILTLVMPTTYFIAVADFAPPESIGPLLHWWMGLLETDDPVSGIKAALGALVFAVCGVGQGFIYALFVPALGEIIDYDEAQLSGQRREALYNGLSGLAFKGSQALSVVLFNLLVVMGGKSVAEPMGIFIVGPVAGVFGLLAIVAISFYPVKSE
jgi:GPH family glycoside/pentoside/hexuronide:cation symporter